MPGAAHQHRQPLPTSSTSTQAVPLTGRGASQKKAGSNRKNPSQRAGNPRGSNNQATPGKASRSAHRGGTGCCHKGQSDKYSSTLINCASNQWSTCSKGGQGNTAKAAPAVMMKLTNGIASALASGEDASENC